MPVLTLKAGMAPVLSHHPTTTGTWVSPSSGHVVDLSEFVARRDVTDEHAALLFDLLSQGIPTPSGFRITTSRGEYSFIREYVTIWQDISSYTPTPDGTPRWISVDVKGFLDDMLYARNIVVKQAMLNDWMKELAALAE